MTRIHEFRITMPFTPDEYTIAHTYVRTTMQQEHTAGGEGVEVLVSEPFSNEEMGTGHYSRTIYHLESKAPAWVRALAPAGSLAIQEECFKTSNRMKLVMTCAYFSKWKVTVDSINVPDRGNQDNIFKLQGADLERRKVQVIDISSNERDLFTGLILKAKAPIDASTIRCEQLNRGPLLPGWQETCEPVMTSYKLVTISTSLFGLGPQLEALCLSAARALMREAHKSTFAAMEQWCHMTIEDVRRAESKAQEEMRQILVKSGKRTQAATAAAAAASSCTSAEGKRENMAPTAAVAAGPKEASMVAVKQQPMTNQRAVLAAAAC